MILLRMRIISAMRMMNAMSNNECDRVRIYIYIYMTVR